MPDKLEWIDNPGIKSQCTIGAVTYYVTFPSQQINLNDPSQSFYEHGFYMATAMKPTKAGFPAQYVVGTKFNNVNHGQTGCQEDYDQYGESFPPGKEPSPPTPI